jgi:cardiolipin synthase A/B
MVQLLFTGQEYFPALIAALQAARHEVRLETYIFNDDAVAEQVMLALVACAARGVVVTLVVDGIGTPELPLDWTERLTKSGVQWHQFSPLGSFGLLIPGRWRRLHRKLCVVDGTLAFCGGINVVDDYFEEDHGPQATPRFDFAVQITGPLVADIRGTMEQFWRRLQFARQASRATFEQVWHRPQQTLAALRAGAETTPDRKEEGMRAGLILRDNVRNRTRIERAYRQAIARAKTEVVIANAYFMPGIKLRRALVHAVQRGVRVRLLLQGRYEHFMQFHAAKAFYGNLLGAGVEIHEYQAGFLHAKVAVVDGQWSTVGSSNLDPLSLLLAREANVVVLDTAFAAKLLQRLNSAIDQDSVQLDKAQFQQRPLGQRLKDRLAYFLMRLTLFLTGRDY